MGGKRGQRKVRGRCPRAKPCKRALVGQEQRAGAFSADLGSKRNELSLPSSWRVRSLASLGSGASMFDEGSKGSLSVTFRFHRRGIALGTRSGIPRRTRRQSTHTVHLSPSVAYS